MGELAVECAGERLVLDADRALIWPGERTGFIADLHLGKSEIFRRSGIPIPEGGTMTDLSRLDRLVATHSLERLVLLGDFLHGVSRGPTTYGSALRSWRANYRALEFIVIAGNHDRRSVGREFSESVEWELQERRIGPFLCRHTPGASKDGFVLAGHLHPVIRLYGSHREHTRVPVCWIRTDYAVLPSFGTFTGGYDIEPATGDRLYAFAADRVWKLPNPC